MRNFWKTNRNKGLELYLKTAIAHEHDRFSHASKPLLRPKTGPVEMTTGQQQAEARLFEAAETNTETITTAHPNYKLHGVNDLQQDDYVPTSKRDRQRHRGQTAFEMESETIVTNLFTAMDKVKPQNDQMKETNQNKAMLDD